MSNDGNNKTFWGFLQRNVRYPAIIIPIVFLLTWIVTHLLASAGGQVEVWGLIKYEKGVPKQIVEQVGYVPLSSVASEDDKEISAGVTVMVRQGGTRLRDTPSLDSPGAFLNEETKVNVVSLKNSWVQIKLRSKDKD